MRLWQTPLWRPMPRKTPQHLRKIPLKLPLFIRQKLTRRRLLQPSGFVLQHEMGRQELEKSLRGRVTTQAINDVKPGVNDESRDARPHCPRQ